MKTIYLIVFLALITSCTKQKANEIFELKRTNQKLTEELLYKTEDQRVCHVIYLRTMTYCNNPVENSQVFWGKDSLNTCDLSQIASKPRLVFCFSTNTCAPCVEKSIDLTKEVFPDYLENENIIITGDYPMKYRNDCYGKKMLSGINLPLHEIEVPFFFILDKNMNISFLHLFNKGDSNYTKIYLSEIRKKFDL